MASCAGLAIERAGLPTAMKLQNDRLSAMSDNPPANSNALAKVHVVKPVAGAAVSVQAPPPTSPLATETRTEPLRIEYSRTQVKADALVRLQRTHGVVKVDRSFVREVTADAQDVSITRTIISYKLPGSVPRKSLK